MRAIVTLGCLCMILTTTAAGASALDVVVLAKPGFPSPATDVKPSGRRHFVLRSMRYRFPDVLPPAFPSPPEWAPRRFRDQDLQFAIRQLRPDLDFSCTGVTAARAGISCEPYDHIVSAQTIGP